MRRKEEISAEIIEPALLVVFFLSFFVGFFFAQMEQSMACLDGLKSVSILSEWSVYF